MDVAFQVILIGILFVLIRYERLAPASRKKDVIICLAFALVGCIWVNLAVQEISWMRFFHMTIATASFCLMYLYAFDILLSFVDISGEDTDGRYTMKELKEKWKREISSQFLTLESVGWLVTIVAPLILGPKTMFWLFHYLSV